MFDVCLIICLASIKTLFVVGFSHLDNLYQLGTLNACQLFNFMLFELHWTHTLCRFMHVTCSISCFFGLLLQCQWSTTHHSYNTHGFVVFAALVSPALSPPRALDQLWHSLPLGMAYQDVPQPAHRPSALLPGHSHATILVYLLQVLGHFFNQ